MMGDSLLEVFFGRESFDAIGKFFEGGKLGLFGHAVYRGVENRDDDIVGFAFFFVEFFEELFERLDIFSITVNNIRSDAAIITINHKLFNNKRDILGIQFSGQGIIDDELGLFGAFGMSKVA